jgi:MFS-type transporter involved in bile tolerance (Atg22 family)
MSLGFAALEHLALGAITFALVMSVGLVLVWRVRRKARKGLRFERSAK